MLDMTFLIQEDTNVKEKDNNPIDMLYLATEIYESIFYYNENVNHKTFGFRHFRLMISMGFYNNGLARLKMIIRVTKVLRSLI